MLCKLLHGTVALLLFSYLGETFLLPAWPAFIGGLDQVHVIKLYRSKRRGSTLVAALRVWVASWFCTAPL